MVAVVAVVVAITELLRPSLLLEATMAIAATAIAAAVRIPAPAPTAAAVPANRLPTLLALLPAAPAGGIGGILVCAIAVAVVRKNETVAAPIMQRLFRTIPPYSKSQAHPNPAPAVFKPVVMQG